MREHATELRGLVSAANNNAKAAAENAAFAQQSMENLIAKERARLKIDIKPLEFQETMIGEIHPIRDI